MTVAEVLYEGKAAIMLIYYISLPLVGAATIVGLTVALFQTVVQLQEQTLGFAAKFTAVLVVFIFLGEWISNEMMRYLLQIFERIANS